MLELVRKVFVVSFSKISTSIQLESASAALSADALCRFASDEHFVLYEALSVLDSSFRREVDF